jgi:hypothetical protein
METIRVGTAHAMDFAKVRISLACAFAHPAALAQFIAI